MRGEIARRAVVLMKLYIGSVVMIQAAARGKSARRQLMLAKEFELERISLQELIDLLLPDASSVFYFE